MLNHELVQKYTNRFTARQQAAFELGSIPLCFDKCIKTINDATLTAGEKNCIRECWGKRNSSRGDFNTMMVQMGAIQSVKGVADNIV